MILLENNVPPVYVDESRDFQIFLRAYNVILNMIKQDADTLQYLTDSEQCESKILPLLKTKLGFFTTYPINDSMLRGILAAFPIIVKSKGSLESIQQSLNVFLKILNIKTEIVIKVTGASSEVVQGSITVDDHTILIAIKSAVENLYILEEIFKYILPAGYQYTFLFYKELSNETWLLNEDTGRFVIVNTLISDSIRSRTEYNDEITYEYNDPEVDKLLNQVNTIGLFDKYDLDIGTSPTPNFTMRELIFEPEDFLRNYFFYYKIENNKYVQLTEAPQAWAENTYYVPQFFSFTNIQSYRLLTADPTLIYKDTSDTQITVRLLDRCYYNYYTLDVDGTYRTLQEPVNEWTANTYYEPIYGKVIARASDVQAFFATQLTSQYIATSTILTEEN